MVRRALARNLEKVVVMPCRISPHKRPDEGNALPVSEEHRLAMLRLALRGVTGADISTHELERPGLSYTWQTLDYLKKSFPDLRWVLVLGMDQFKALPQWDRFEDWGTGVDYLVFRREGVSAVEISGFQSLQVDWAQELIPGVAASEIRRRVRCGESIQNQVSPLVEEYIRDFGLYKTHLKSV